jgi:hypothetical protein
VKPVDGDWKWDVSHENPLKVVVVTHTTSGERVEWSDVAEFRDEETAKKATVLPEALALLDDWQHEHGKKCDCTRCTRTLDVLRRAGVAE